MTRTSIIPDQIHLPERYVAYVIGEAEREIVRSRNIRVEFGKQRAALQHSLRDMGVKVTEHARLREQIRQRRRILRYGKNARYLM